MIRVGLVGYGLAGTAFHAPFITTTPGLELSVVITSDAGRQAQARASHPGVEVLATAEALWQLPKRVDLVVVATANVAHVPIARAAIRAGIAVLVDKPLAPSAADARMVVQEAARAGVPLTVFQNRRWDGDVRTLRKLLADGALGEPIRFESRFERWRLEARTGWRGSADPKQAGGLLVDLGSHLIDQALWLFGPATDVYAELDRRRPGSEVDDDAFVAITHASGMRSHLWMSILVSQRGPRLRVLGTKASYVKFGMDVQEDALRRGDTPGSMGWGEEPEANWGLLGDDDQRRPVRTLVGDYGALYRSLAEAVSSGGPMPVNPNDAVAVLDVIEAARRSAADRRVVSLS